MFATRLYATIWFSLSVYLPNLGRLWMISFDKIKWKKSNEILYAPILYARQAGQHTMHALQTWGLAEQDVDARDEHWPRHVCVLRSNPLRSAHSHRRLLGSGGCTDRSLVLLRLRWTFRRLCSAECCFSGTDSHGAGAWGLVGAPCARTF